ncbi:hypothetical protein MMC07_001516 [Pseudocyphellaria aurata]|nr:hypothetical protein [Pseudocyphellaria aurata]
MRLYRTLLGVTLFAVPASSARTTPVSVTVTGTKIPAPTASPLPPVSNIVEAFIGELATAILYASLIGNDNDLASLCPLINPPALSNISGINGEIVRGEVCAAAKVVAQNSAFGEQLVLENQRGVSLLATALFAVQVAGDYAGGTDLNRLCSEIEAELINLLFINYVDDLGTKVKDYVCNAAESTPTKSSSSNATSEKCTSPTGFANEIVRAPDNIARAHFYPSFDFDTAHNLFEIVDVNIDLPEAVIARFCLDKCIAYSSAGGNRTCLSIFVDQGTPYPPGRLGNDTAPRWFCAGFDAPLSADLYRKIDSPDNFLYGLGINRLCDGTYRAY